MRQNNFIELNRLFNQLSAENTKSDYIDGRKTGTVVTWNELINEYRVILLAEAGSGKTEEIRQITKRLREEGKHAFFLRLEHIQNGFEESFEEGNHNDFLNWINSNDEGWFFLDSVDEARLKDPKDFERAIRILSSKLATLLQRTHIVITSRAHAWRFSTDLKICRKHIPFMPPTNSNAIHIDDQSILDDGISIDSDNYSTLDSDDEAKDFLIYSLADLTAAQIKNFVNTRGINDTAKFLDDIDRYDAWAYTTRPQDLEEVIEYWNENGKIGTHLELIQNSINRRLKERDQDRAESESLTDMKVREGAKLIAIATIFMQDFTIQVPDGSNYSQGINAKSILVDWTDKECVALLGRPLFDEAIYGTVRFHHRSVREYLAAEWLADFLKDGAARKTIESLFIRKKYGIKVLTPSLKLILVWLIVFDEKIRAQACRIEPEIILQGGAPNELPINTRREILKSVCEKISSNTADRLVTHYGAIQRFANNDIADTIVNLLTLHQNNPQVIFFLLQMVWYGSIKQALPQVKKFAIDSKTEKFSRTSAVRALKTIGTKEDFDLFLKSALLDEPPFERRFVAEIVCQLDPTETSLMWVFNILEKTMDRDAHRADGLVNAIINFVEQLDITLLGKFISLAMKLINQGPMIEHTFCEISVRFSWLVICSSKAIKKLILAHSPLAFSSDSLITLIKVPALRRYEIHPFNSIDKDLPELIRGWSELNHALFWKSVEETRSSYSAKNGQRLINYWLVGMLGQLWGFGEVDFDTIKSDITTRELVDDKLVALSLAFKIYVDNDRPPKWRLQLKKEVDGLAILQKSLEELLHPSPPSEAEREIKKQQAKWERKSKNRNARERAQEEKNLIWLSHNYEKLYDIQLAKEGDVSRAQYYLLEKMREKMGNTAHWTSGNWKSLIQDYGQDVANAFRKGMLTYWRNHQPFLRSEKDGGSNTPISVIFGLAGLEVESIEIDNWPSNLNEHSAALACRYALHELNGFPSWLPKLFEKFPSIVSSYILREIRWELETTDEEIDKNYIINRVSWNGQWLWNQISSDILNILMNETINLKYLSSLLKIVQNSVNILDAQIENLAKKNCQTTNEQDKKALWYAAWAGVSPNKAIPSLGSHLKKIVGVDEAEKFAMIFIVNLIGSRTNGANVREAFKSPQYLIQLYLLMHQYIKINADINRADTGVYTPRLRDDAQDARNSLFSILKDIPGKETYSAIIYLSKKHPSVLNRSWMIVHARKRAEIDADITPWSYSDLNTFITYCVSYGGNLMNKLAVWEKVAGYIFGFIFIAALLIITILIPNPTASQFAVFRTVLALAAAGVGGVFSGFIHVEGKFQQWSIRAGGALALFVIVFFCNPAKLNDNIEVISSSDFSVKVLDKK